ncbi:glycoside hydrolase family 3 C-terminal domain-containing protein [Candidatus Saccharibacteria bacterium TM7i]|nr:glycoside hydrolase family 3 C-terminal domain-containing protein [Candidatus Saccharibacteria bacterium TM7i]
MGKYKELVAEYKQKAKRKYEALKVARRKRRELPLKEQFTLLKEDRSKRLAWKRRIKKVQDPREQYAQKKGYKQYRKLQNRKFKWGIAIGVVVIIGLLFTHWLITATKPLTSDQMAARKQSLNVARQVMDEGTVLLKNENNTLPLKDTAVNVFGAGSAAPIYSGGGAGGISSASAQSLYAAFEEEGINYNPTLYNLYNNFAHKNKVSTDEFKEQGKTLLDILLPNIAGFLVKSPKEMPASSVNGDILSEAKRHSDTALYVVSRAGTETVDFKPEELTLTQDERDTVALLDKNFEHIIILVNTTNVMELGFVNEFKHIDSVLWIGGPGEVGARSIAATLKGEVTPSGKLTDTYMYDIAANPAVKNTGNFQYQRNPEDECGTCKERSQKRYFVNYQENVYVGYRYYETFEKTEAVQYPFGYGLSYTNFAWTVGKKTATNDIVSADVTVTNNGPVAGKDVVQLYFSAPFTHDGVERPSVELGGYKKTKLLQPGESETVTIQMKTRDMAAFDDKIAKTWVMEAGTYGLSIRRDVRTPVELFTYEQPARATFSVDSVTGQAVKNQFDHARGSGINYLSRSYPETTKVTAPSNFTIPSFIFASDYSHEKSTAPVPTTNAKNDLKLADLKGINYDDPKWQNFIEQLNKDELVRLAGHGGYWSVAIDRLGVPRTSMYDGPTSIRNFLGSWASVAYPIPANLSASWNDELAEKVGEAMGKEAQSFNVNATYAPSLNMHRSPLGGRNFEYYSEDPLIAGKIGAAVTRGLQSTDTVAIIKHFVANDQETNRAAYGLYTWTTEQALREIYLKPFEIAVKEGQPNGVMSAFNRIGTTWAGGDKALLNTVLRDEWGFRGFVITDAGLAGQGDHFDALQAVESGNDMMLASPIDAGENTFEKQLKTYLKKDEVGTLIALQNAAHNILYYVLQTGVIK